MAEQTTEAQRFGWFGYPVVMVDREDIGSGVYLIKDDAEFRTHILDDLSYMKDEDDASEQAEFARLEAMDTETLIEEYLDIDSDWTLAPAFVQKPVEEETK